MKRHEWRERSEDGDVTIYRAARHGGRWTLQSKLKGADWWNKHEPFTREDVEILRAMLERKYQRNRVPYEHLESLEKLLEDIE